MQKLRLIALEAWRTGEHNLLYDVRREKGGF